MDIEMIDVTAYEADYAKLESGKVKIIVLDGVKVRSTIITLPEHGQTVIETAKGAGHKLKYMVGEFLLK